MLTLPQIHGTLPMKKIKERWVPIKGYPNYEVSNHGRVRSLDHTVECNSRWGTPRQMLVKGMLLKASPTHEFGYLEVKLCHGGVCKTHRVHQLVARAFLGKPPKGKTQVLHADDDPTNAHVLNLSWGSQADNLEDMRSKGRSDNVGTTHWKAGLTEKEVLKIVRLLRKDWTVRKIVDTYGFSLGAIYAIRSGATWSHLTGIRKEL
jgi:hypothetical protein